MTFHRIGALAELWQGDMLATTIDGIDIVVIRVDDDTVRAYRNRCAHLGVPLSDGSLDGCVLTCSAHHWQYDARTGRGINPATTQLPRFETKVEDGMIYVKL